MAPPERLLKDRIHPRDNVARTNMVNCQLRPNGVLETELIEAFTRVPMEAFVPPAIQLLVYADADLPLTTDPQNKRWLLAPMTLGKLLQLAKIQKTDKVLIVGCGTGYSIALVAQMAAHVIGVECDDVLASLARIYAADQEIFNIQVVTGPLSVGYPKEAPYDVILIEGAIEQVPQGLLQGLLQQLSPQEGRIVTVIKESVKGERLKFGQGTLMIRTEDQITEVRSFDASCPHLPEFEPAEVFRLS